MTRIRENITDVSVSSSAIESEGKSDEIIRYFNRNDDHGLLKDALEQAYDVGIGNIDLTDGEKIETYVSGNFREKLESGEIDALNVGWGHKVANAKATLFNEPGLKFSLVHDSKETSLDDVQEILNRHRKKGGYIAANVSANRVAVFHGSCLMLVTYLRGNLRYKKIYPGQVRVKWGENIIEDDEKRPVDTLDIEDASVVLIRLGQVGVDQYSYLGIIPSNPEVPLGRYVTFVGSLTCSEIPKPGKDGAIDYRLPSEKEGKPGEPVNPLSYLAAQHPERDIPEIPLAIMMGGTTDADVLCPTFETLYEQSLIFDKKTSHILGKADEKAAGTLAIERDAQATGQPLPRRTTGVVPLQQGQKIVDIAHDASACEIAHAIKRADMIDTAAEYAVPDFMVVSEDHTVDASSGIALQVKSRALVKDRDFCISLNEPYVERLFQIEAAILEFKEDEDRGLLATLAECRQEWEAGVLQLPENKKEKTERINARIKAGTLDVIGGLQEEHNFASDEEAIELYEKMKERAKKYPPLNQEEEQKQRQGLMRGFNRQQNGGTKNAN